jgi:ATP-dependent Clp protease ATP-binding subunit ClpA
VTEEDGVKALGFVYPEGPVLPKPDREVVESAKKRVRPEPEVRRARARRARERTSDKGNKDDGSKGGVVPQVPLKG